MRRTTHGGSNSLFTAVVGYNVLALCNQTISACKLSVIEKCNAALKDLTFGTPRDKILVTDSLKPGVTQK